MVNTRTKKTDLWNHGHKLEGNTLDNDFTPVAIVDPRKAMKQVRADVKTYLKGNNHSLKPIRNLGEYPTDMPTAVRTIIALQDLLEASMVRHAKASDHVESLQITLHDTTIGVRDTLTSAGKLVHGKDSEIESLRNQIKMTMESTAEIECANIEQESEIADLKALLDSANLDKIALIQTIQILTTGGEE